MDIRKYQLFADAAQTHNFTRSGRHLGYSQSGVSHILKSLETELGFRLFTRDRHGVLLTPEAQQLLPYVQTVLKDHEALMQQVREISRSESGSKEPTEP